VNFLGGQGTGGDWSSFLNVHWHVIVPDALFVPDATGKHVTVQPLRAPSRLDLEEIVTAVAARCVRWLEQHGTCGARATERRTVPALTLTPTRPG
jgi:hypothetical protein